MTAAPDSEEAHTAKVSDITERLENYTEVLDEQKECVEGVLSDLEDAPDDECLTREEYRRVFPASMPLEEWGGFGG